MKGYLSYISGLQREILLLGLRFELDFVVFYCAVALHFHIFVSTAEYFNNSFV